MHRLHKKNYQYYEDINHALLSMIPKDKFILDVGCGFGYLGKQLKKKGNTVYGIDIASEVEEQASKRLDKFFLGDAVNPRNLPAELKKNSFDIIVFADVLEHIYDPYTVFSYYSKLLKPDGSIYVSIPNVAIWAMRLGLLFGCFNYTDTGTLDRTHIRFFTKSALYELVDSLGFEVREFNLNPGIIRPLVPLIKKLMFMHSAKHTSKPHDPKSIINSSSFKIYEKYLMPIEKLFSRLWPSLFAFQFVVRVTKKKHE